MPCSGIGLLGPGHTAEAVVQLRDAPRDGLQAIHVLELLDAGRGRHRRHRVPVRRRILRLQRQDHHRDRRHYCSQHPTAPLTLEFVVIILRWPLPQPRAFSALLKTAPTRSPTSSSVRGKHRALSRMTTPLGCRKTRRSPHSNGPRKSVYSPPRILFMRRGSVRIPLPSSSSVAMATTACSFTSVHAWTRRQPTLTKVPCSMTSRECVLTFLRNAATRSRLS